MSAKPQSLIPNPELDVLVRRADEDRWLASRFAPADVRAKLIAIYAVNYELARVSDVAREPGIGVIRLAWWRDALEELAAGEPARAHPALLALQETCPARAGAFARIVEARGHDLEDAAFASAAALEAYVDATAGALMRMAARACALAEAERADAFITQAGRAWGYAGLARAGRKAPVDLRACARAAYAAAKPLARDAASVLFPAVGYVALTPAYLRAHAPSLLARQLKLIAASATGWV